MSTVNTYFDYASATPVRGDVFNAMAPYYAEKFMNPSALYDPAREVRADIENARFKIASILECKPRCLVFTSGTTESNNMAIQGVMAKFPHAHIIYGASEHDSVRVAAQRYASVQIPLLPSGPVDYHRINELATDTTVLVSVMLVNNETGVINPIRKIRKIMDEILKDRQGRGIQMPLYLHADAAQAPLTQKLVISSLGVDMLSFGGSKIYGPKGIGVLYISPHVQLDPLIFGGGQESGYRSGTENVPGIIGLSDALLYAHSEREELLARLTILRNTLEDEAQKMGWYIHGQGAPRSPHITSMYMPGIDNERAVFELSSAGVYVASGSACHAQTGEQSATLAAMGVDTDTARSTLRISIGRDTTAGSVDVLLKALASIKS